MGSLHTLFIKNLWKQGIKTFMNMLHMNGETYHQLVRSLSSIKNEKIASLRG